MSNGKCFLFVLFVIAGFVTSYQNVLAQERPSYYSSYNDSTWAIQFKIGKNFSLSNFSGTLISFQKTLSQRNAIRWGLSLSGGFDKNHSGSTVKNKQGNINTTITMNYLWYAHLQHRIRFYYGLGPRLLFKYQNTWHDQTDQQITTKMVQTDEGFGVEGVIGAEWFINNHMSLVAEYLPLIEGRHTFRVTRYYQNEYDVQARSSLTTTSANIGSEPVRFGISIYF